MPWLDDEHLKGGTILKGGKDNQASKTDRIFTEYDSHRIVAGVNQKKNERISDLEAVTKTQIRNLV